MRDHNPNVIYLTPTCDDCAAAQYHERRWSEIPEPCDECGMEPTRYARAPTTDEET